MRVFNDFADLFDDNFQEPTLGMVFLLGPAPCPEFSVG
jgi:hypothetical protein